jgi:hypothetical protein
VFSETQKVTLNACDFKCVYIITYITISHITHIKKYKEFNFFMTYCILGKSHELFKRGKRKE